MGNGANFEDLIFENKLEKLVLKPIRGVQGKGIHFISCDAINQFLRNVESEGEQTIPKELMNQDFIVQERVKQHPELSRINPYSLNTIRIITFLTQQNGVEYLAAMLRTSSNQSRIDNFSIGGIVVGIDLETGKLKKRGFLKPQYGNTFKKHPLTETEFYNFKIPYWGEVKEIAYKAQKAFYNLKSIGWDFAITEDGPVLIEGNIEWGTAGIQAANSGLLTQKNRALFAQYGLRFRE